MTRTSATDVVADTVSFQALRAEDLETVYVSPDAPDPKDTLIVLAFILSPTEAFCDGDSDARELLQTARCEAAENWRLLRNYKPDAIDN